MWRSSPSSAARPDVGRGLVAVAVGVVAAVALGNLAPPSPGSFVPLVACAAAAGYLGLRGRGIGWWFVCGVLGGAAACARAPRVPASGREALPVRFVATVRDGWSGTPFGHANRVRIENLADGRGPLRGYRELRVEVAGGARAGDLPPPGTRIRGSGELQRGRGGQLVPPTLRVESVLLLAVEDSRPSVDRLREGLLGAVLRAAGTSVSRIDAAGLAAALALGRRESLRAGEVTALRTSGLAHLLAVSGLHVGIVGMIVWALLVLARIPPWWRRWALAAFLVGFGFVAGGYAPVRRAVAAAVAYLLARQLGRPLEPLPTMWGIVAALLILEPDALLAPGFQLSALVALALVRWVGPLADALPFLPRRLAQAVAVALVAQLAAAPLQGGHFGYVPLLGVASNLAMAPLAVLMTSLSVTAAAAAPASGAVTAWLLDGLALLQGVLDRLAHAATVGTVPFPPPTAVAAGLFAVAAVWALGRGRGAAAVAAATALGVALWIIGVPWAGRAGGELRLLSVSDGMSVLVRAGSTAMLVDGGRSPQESIRALSALRVRHLDAVVVTHGDADHTGGVPAVLQWLHPRRVILPAQAAEVPEMVTLRRLARRWGVEEELVGAGQRLRVGRLVVDVLSPPAGFRGSDNDASLVMAVRLPGARVLFTGDIEAAGERALLAARLPLRADVLQLPHHGSRTSSTAPFLAAVAPVAAFAATGERPRYRYPHPEVVRRLVRQRIVLASQAEGVRWLGVESDWCSVGTREPVRVRWAKGKV